jgi:divalent metal cation (Fe/Co/Zn/Cd) transporter
LEKSKAFDKDRQATASVCTLPGIGMAEIIVSTTTRSLILNADGLDSIADALV